MRDIDDDRYRGRDGRIDKKLLHLRGLVSDLNLFDDDIGGEALGVAPLREARGFRVRRVLEGRYFAVGVFGGGELGERTVVRGYPHDPDAVVTFLSAREGEEVPVADTGRHVTLHLDDPLAIRAALAAYGEIHDVGGDEPPGWPS